MRMRSIATLLASMVMTSGALVQSARADTVGFDLVTNNIGASGVIASVLINLTSATTADVTFDANDAAGFLIAGNNSAGVNVNATTWGISNLSVTQIDAFNPASPTATAMNGGNLDGFGSFNQLADVGSGFSTAVDTLKFTLTDLSGIWASAASVLIANDAGWLAGIHFAVCATNPCTLAGGVNADVGGGTGFAVGNGPTPVPVPPALGLLFSGLVGMGLLGRRRRNKPMTEALA